MVCSYPCLIILVSMQCIWIEKVNNHVHVVEILFQGNKKRDQDLEENLFFKVEMRESISSCFGHRINISST